MLSECYDRTNQARWQKLLLTEFSVGIDLFVESQYRFHVYVFSVFLAFFFYFRRLWYEWELNTRAVLPHFTVYKT